MDSFAGAGGASIGIEAALGRPVDIAINHDAAAIAAHQANHPETRHYQCDVFEVDPVEATGGRPVGLAWFSPDCTHHSKAKGGKPRCGKRRALAWVVVRWAAAVRPRVIMLENVEEFAGWGPLGRDGRPCPRRRGETFRAWVGHLEALGYRVEYRELVAADYGAPTTRKRLFLIARCDGRPIVWPKPSHGLGRRAPWRTAAEIIDWGLPCPSIFGRKKPLAEKTLVRIAKGLERFVFGSLTPYMVGGAGLAPFLVKTKHGGGGFRGQSLEAPLYTVTSKNGDALCAAFLAKHYGGVVGHGVERPLGAVTAVDHHSLVAGYLAKLRGTSHSAGLDSPLPTITAGGTHLAEVRAFLVKYYGAGFGQSIGEPCHTITTKDRLGLVTVCGADYVLADIGLRMLQPHELMAAQGFPETYRLDGSKATRVRLIGNSVCPPVAEALVRANAAECGAEAVA